MERIELSAQRATAINPSVIPSDNTPFRLVGKDKSGFAISPHKS
jgi:hypothetical protein